MWFPSENVLLTFEPFDGEMIFGLLVILAMLVFC